MRAVITVRFTSRYGTVFANEDAGILGGLLDPANKGHFAKTVENNFKNMAAFVVQSINKTLEKHQTEKVKQPAAEEIAAKPLPPVRLIGGSMGEPRVSDMLPQALKPGGPALSALTTPPKN